MLWTDNLSVPVCSWSSNKCLRRTESKLTFFSWWLPKCSRAASVYVFPEPADVFLTLRTQHWRAWNSFKRPRSALDTRISLVTLFIVSFNFSCNFEGCGPVCYSQLNINLMNFWNKLTFCLLMHLLFKWLYTSADAKWGCYVSSLP